MDKKIATMFVIGCLLTTSFVSIGSLAKNQQSITVITNKSLDEKLNGFLDSLNEKNILNPELINIIRNKIIFNNYDGEIIPGTFIFTPCNPIDIEGIGIVDYDGSFGYLCLDEGTAELDNTFSRNYLKDEIGAICIFEEFEGEIIGEPEESSPLKVTGQSGLFILVEYSHLLAIYIDEMFYTGVEVPVIITNIKDSSEVEITETLFTVYRNVLLSPLKIYEEQIQETWIIPIGDTKTWYWDQKDQNGKQVSKGDYIIAGEFTINGRVHPLVMSFEIQKKSRNEKNIQTLLSKILNDFPIIQKIVDFFIL